MSAWKDGAWKDGAWKGTAWATDDAPPEPEPPAPDLAMSSVLIQQSRRLFMEDEEIIIL